MVHKEIHKFKCILFLNHLISCPKKKILNYKISHKIRECNVAFFDTNKDRFCVCIII